MPIGDMSMKKNADRWAFLEDIEAPMWVDLTAEAMLSNKELDDEWFLRSHKFHQLPSRKLKAAFKHIDIGGKLEIGVGGSSSPTISSSVSRARGKYYSNDIVGIDFQLSLSGMECLKKDADDEALQSQYGNEMVPKSSNEDSTLSSHLDQEDDGRGEVDRTLPSTSTLPNTNSAVRSNHSEHKVGVRGPKSSITTESMPRAEVVVPSNHIVGRRSQLMPAIRLSLRKSCTTRMAVRGQITDAQQTVALRPSVGKSSVGSCSIHSQDAKDMVAGVTQRASRTPESKHVERQSQESKTRDKVKTSTYGLCQSTSNGDRGEALKTKAKPGSLYPHRAVKRDSSTRSASLKITSSQRASKFDSRGKAGMPKNIKTSTATRLAQCVNSNGSISKLFKSASVKAVPEHSSNSRKLTVQKGTNASIFGKDSVNKEVGKSVVTKPTQLQNVTTSKVPLTHRRPLAPVNLNGEGLHRRPLAPTKQVNQGSLPFAQKTTMRGKSDALTKSFSQGKENIVSNLATNKRQGNGLGIAARGMAEKINKVKLTEARKNNVQGLLSRKELLRREPAITSKLKTKSLTDVSKM